LKLKDVTKGSWIINRNIPDAAPWYVCGKNSGMVIIRRGPKIGKLLALTAGQLRVFEMTGKPDHIGS